MIVKGYDYGTNSVVELNAMLVNYDTGDSVWDRLETIDANTGIVISTEKFCRDGRTYRIYTINTSLENYSQYGNEGCHFMLISDVRRKDGQPWIDAVNLHLASTGEKLGRFHDHALEGDVIPGFHDDYYELEKLPLSYELDDLEWLSKPVDLRPERLEFGVSNGYMEAYIITDKYGEGMYDINDSQLLDSWQYRLPDSKATLCRQLKQLLDEYEVF